MLQIGYNTTEAFEKEYKLNDPTKYIFEAVTTGFDFSIPKGMKKSQEALDSVKDKLMSVAEGEVDAEFFEKMMKNRYKTDLKFIKVHDIMLRHNKWIYFFVFRTVKPMTVKEYIDYFEPDSLCYVYYPCDVVKIFENE